MPAWTVYVFPTMARSSCSSFVRAMAKSESSVAPCFFLPLLAKSLVNVSLALLRMDERLKFDEDRGIGSGRFDTESFEGNTADGGNIAGESGDANIGGLLACSKASANACILGYRSCGSFSSVLITTSFTSYGIVPGETIAFREVGRSFSCLNIS